MCNISTDLIICYLAFSTVIWLVVCTERYRIFLPDKSAPRHLTVDPVGGSWVCIVNETSNTAIIIPFDPHSGKPLMPEVKLVAVGGVVSGSESESRCGSTPSTVYEWDNPGCSTLPAHFLFSGDQCTDDCHMCAAEILVSANGRFLYISNRDIFSSSDEESQCSVCVMAVDSADSPDGRHLSLMPLQHVYTKGALRALS